MPSISMSGSPNFSMPWLCIQTVPSSSRASIFTCARTNFSAGFAAYRCQSVSPHSLCEVASWTSPPVRLRTASTNLTTKCTVLSSGETFLRQPDAHNHLRFEKFLLVLGRKFGGIALYQLFRIVKQVGGVVAHEDIFDFQMILFNERPQQTKCSLLIALSGIAGSQACPHVLPRRDGRGRSVDPVLHKRRCPCIHLGGTGARGSPVEAAARLEDASPRIRSPAAIR